MSRLVRIAGYAAMILAAVVAANLITTHYAAEGHPEVSVYTAFGLIAFDLVARDRLDDLLGRSRLPMMAALVVAGSALSYLLNADAARIALASAVAFAGAFSTDTLVYGLARARGWSWLERSNVSNVASSLVDSVLFVALAFPGFLFGVAFGQFTAKVAGGVVFSLAFDAVRSRRPRLARGKGPLRATADHGGA